jgi:hypothetical protein
VSLLVAIGVSAEGFREILGVVDRDTAVDQHQLEVAVADQELQVPPDRP